MPSLCNRLFAESIGTFILVFFGTGAIVVDRATAAIAHPGIALTFGLVVLALVYSLGDISGAHLNPAVTLGFAAARRFPIREVGPYLAGQFLGALAASLLLVGLFPDSSTYGETIPRGPVVQSFVLEVVMTWFLMLVILCVSSGSKEKGVVAGVAVGAVITLEAMFAGPICGASMNPARSLAPAIASGRFDSIWVYLLAPTLGALLAVPTLYLLKPFDNSKPDPLLEIDQ